MQRRSPSIRLLIKEEEKFRCEFSGGGGGESKEGEESISVAAGPEGSCSVMNAAVCVMVHSDMGEVRQSVRCVLIEGGVRCDGEALLM